MKRVYRSPTSVLSNSLPLQWSGGLVPEKLGRGVWPASQNPYPTTSGPYTESALPFLNLLDVLTVNNVYCLHALKFTHLWHKGLLPSLFDNLFQYASYRHTHNTRYASKQNFYKPRPRTNTGKQMFSYQAIDLWRDIPYSLKDLSTFSFAKEIKHYLLSEQYSKKFE